MEGRQQGKTITSAACILWYTLFQESKTVAILANKAAAAREVMSRY
jgi:phage terminase large subunit-like protein